MKKIVILLVVITVLFILNGVGVFAQEQVWEFKLGSKMIETHPESQGVLKFIKFAAKSLELPAKLQLLPQSLCSGQWNQALR